MTSLSHTITLCLTLALSFEAALLECCVGLAGRIWEPRALCFADEQQAIFMSILATLPDVFSGPDAFYMFSNLDKYYCDRFLLSLIELCAVSAYLYAWTIRPVGVPNCH